MKLRSPKGWFFVNPLFIGVYKDYSNYHQLNQNKNCQKKCRFYPKFERKTLYMREQHKRKPKN
nr:MAG TPA: hypothetical protein [Bacteriophage sp.]